MPPRQQLVATGIALQTQKPGILLLTVDIRRTWKSGFRPSSRIAEIRVRLIQGSQEIRAAGCTAGLGVFVRSPDLAVDVTPWNDWRVPTFAVGNNRSGGHWPGTRHGRIQRRPGTSSDFIKAMHR